ncbi:MAG: tRNA (adenosine(37)-N6)-threonylcarbamoyltransferase complex ATPase subunit type 1 TsaE [Syntrophales bacterium]
MVSEGCKPYKKISARKEPLILVSHSPSETLRIGRILGDSLTRGDCVALTGELGAGKTCLTQGIAKGLGVPECYVVTSPTFTLVNEYPGRDAILYHVDVYRLTGSADLIEMGYEEYLLGNGVMVIEWAEKIPDDIPEDALCIGISYLNENERRIEISGGPDRLDVRELDLTEGGC